MLKKLIKKGFKEKKFNTGEININYVAGPKNGPTLVLIPGQGLSLESYQRVLAPLSQKFEVFAVDIRGHGKSDWTPGKYNFNTMGKDIELFLKKVVKRPAIISGNSSGGLIALWLAANIPDYVSGIILEDTPVFSAEWPRLKDDCWVYRIFKRNSETIGNPKGRNLAAFFKDLEIPIEGKQRVIKFPDWLGNILAKIIQGYQYFNPEKPVDLPFLPLETRFLVKCLSIYDTDFTRSFVDGSACKNFDHSEALKKVQCPLLVLHANWFRTPEHGLVESMDDDDIARLKSLVPHCQYKRITSGHMIHLEHPQEYLKEVEYFAKTTNISDKKNRQNNLPSVRSKLLPLHR